MNSCMVIINADDFGMSLSVNDAIMAAFERGLLSSTTLLVNMAGFDDAVKKIHAHSLTNVGLHLNLFEGKPLTEAMNTVPCFVENNLFHGKAVPPLIPGQYQEIIYYELKAQIEKFLQIGFLPMHLDSHAHRHTNWTVGGILIRLAEEYSIPAIRQSNNLRKTSFKRKFMTTCYNHRLGRLRKTTYFGNIPEATAALTKISGVMEVMCHPRFDADRHLLDFEIEGGLERLLAPFERIEHVTYSQLNS